MVNQPEINNETTAQELSPLLSDKPGFKSRVASIFKEYWYLSLAFIVPAVIMYLIYLSMGIHPIGEGSVLVLDLNGQYVSFYEGLRHFVYGDASLLYSFSRALGGEFMGMYAYYLASPFSYIVALFPQEKILEALLTIFLIKTGLCGFTFGFYLHKTSKDHKRFNRINIVTFSVMYALTAYAVVQQHNSMWIDAVLWLPIITYGIEELIKKGHYKLYTIALAISVMSNFYIGWMTCIYCAAYFFIYYYMHNENKRNNPYGEKAHLAKSFVRIAIFSAIALAISAVILLTAYYSLSFGKQSFSNTNWEFSMRFDLLDMLVKFLPCSYDTVRPEGLPFVYCGVLTLLLVPVYFCSSRFSLREKILSGVFVAFFLLSFVISPVDLVWHGFQKPNWLNYRYSFMLSFFLLVLAYKGMLEIKKTSPKILLTVSALLALFVGIVQKLELDTYVLGEGSNDRNHEVGKLLTLECIWGTLICVAAYLIILSAARKSLKPQNISLVLAIVVSLECFGNGIISCLDLGSDVVYTSYTTYHNTIDPLRTATTAVTETDKSFYRLEEIKHRKANDNIAVNVKGLTNSTSTLNATTIQFLHNMGYFSKSHESRYFGGNMVADSLLNMKYILAGSEDGDSKYDGEFKNNKEILADDRYYTPYYFDDDYTVYQSNYYLSLAYAVDAGIVDFDISEYQNPYEMLNALVTAMLGEDETIQVYKPLEDYEIIKNNLTDKTRKPVSSSNYKYPLIQYDKIDTEEAASIQVVLNMPYIDTDEDTIKNIEDFYSDYDNHGEKNPYEAETQFVYFYFPSEFHRAFTFSTGAGESYGSCYGNGGDRSLFIGEVTEGSTFKVTLTLEAANLYQTKDVPLFYYIDYSAYEYVMEKLSTTLVTIDDGCPDDHLTGSVKTTKDTTTIFTSIPYDSGWKLLIDGKEVEYYGILGDSSLENKSATAEGAVIAFNIEGAGEHSIELAYKPKAFTFGLTITIIGSLLLLLIILFEKPLNKLFSKILFPITVPVSLPDNDDTKIDSESNNGLTPSISLEAMAFEEPEPIDQPNNDPNGDK